MADKLFKIASEMHKKFCEVVELKYDIELKVRTKEHEVTFVPQSRSKSETGCDGRSTS